MADAGDDLTNCPVCFEEYTETGDHIPRLLPCSHSLCEKCLKILIRNNKMDCPECRVKHEATSGTRSFPQNKYIVTHLLKRQSIEENEKRDKIYFVKGRFEYCPEHGREKSFFCKETGCQKSVCPICFARHHKNHQYIDLEVQKKKCEPLLAKIKELNGNLQEKRSRLVLIKEESEKEKVACGKAIELGKEKVMKKISSKFESMLKEVDNMTIKDVDGKITSVDESINLLDNMKIMDPTQVTDYVITSMLETVRDMAAQTMDFEAGNSSNIKYKIDEITDELIARLCGQLQYPGKAAKTYKGEKQLSASDFKLTGICKTAFSVLYLFFLILSLIYCNFSYNDLKFRLQTRPKHDIMISLFEIILDELKHQF